jgi:hypothetical protein
MSLEDRHAVGNAADEQQVKAAGKREAKRESHRRDDLKALLQSRISRRIIMGWIKACGVYETSYVQGDSQAMAFNEGRRRVGLMLRENVLQAGAEYMGMMEVESKEDEERS